MAAEKELKVKLTGDATQLGKESKKAVDSLNEVKNVAASLLSTFTGGFLGGGIMGAITTTITIVSDKLREARQLVLDADKADLRPKTLKGIRRAETVLDLGGSITSSIQSLRQARQDAEFGDPNAIAAFSKLGLSLKEIKDLKPDELFARVADVFKGRNLNRDARLGLASLIGKQAADDLTPYFAGGEDSQLRKEWGLNPQRRLNFWNLGGMSASSMSDVETRRKFRTDVEPLSMYGLGDEEKAARIAQETAQRREATARSLLTIEQQIAEVARTKAELESRRDAETNSVKRAKLDADVAGLEAESVRLGKEAALTGKTPAAATLQRFTSQADEFAQRGMFIGGQQRVPSILEKSFVELQTIVREIRETRKDNKQNFG